MTVALADLRRFAVARSLFPPTTLTRALNTMGFVQADPIRSPARAQDLTLRHRVNGYRAGDLERKYASLGIEEDVFVNYGFVPGPVWALMHPRASLSHWPPGRRKRVLALLDFVRERGTVHPREADGLLHGTGKTTGEASRPRHAPARGHELRSLLRVVGREAAFVSTGPRHAADRDTCVVRKSTRSSTSSWASMRRCPREPSYVVAGSVRPAAWRGE